MKNREKRDLSIEEDNMTESSSNSKTQMPTEDFGELVSRYFDGQASANDARRLSDQLVADADLRDVFVAVSLQRQLIASRLAPEYEAAASPRLSDAEQGMAILREVLDMEREARAKREAAAAEQAERRRSDRALRAESYARLMGQRIDTGPTVRHYVIPTWAAYGTVAAVVAIAAAIIWPMFQSDHVAPQPKVETAPPQAVQAYAEIVEMDAAVWSGPSAAFQVGRALGAEPLHLDSGHAVLLFNNGARLMLQGPLRATLDDANRVTVGYGDVAANVPQSGRGFTVRSQGLELIDLGTEFGVAVAESGETELHVFRGAVQLRKEGKSAANGETFLSNRAVRFDPQSQAIEPIHADGPRFAWAMDHLKYLNTNLVNNGDFEQEPYAIANGPANVTPQATISGWQIRSDGELPLALSYMQARDHLFPDPDQHVVSPTHGNGFFCIRDMTAEAEQEISLVGIKDLIDQNLLACELSAWIGGYIDQTDAIRLVARFNDDLDHRTRPDITLGPVTLEDRKSVTAFERRTTNAIDVPARTRSVILTIEAADGRTFVDGFMDDIELELFFRSAE